LPDLTKVSSKVLDITRKIDHQYAAAWALRSLEDGAGWEIVDGFFDNDGKLTAQWCPFDYGDGVHLRMRLSEYGELTKSVLNQVEAFAFTRYYGIEEPKVYVLTSIKYPETYSDRIWEFSCEMVGESWTT
jgi:hypothetical protein